MKKLLCTSLILLTALPGIQTFAQNNPNNIDNNTLSIVESEQDISTYSQSSYILEDNVNFRRDPGLSSVILRQLHTGYQVTIDKERNYVTKDGYTWAPIIYNGIKGWVAIQYISMPG